MKDKNTFTVGDIVEHKKWDSIGTIKRFRLLDKYLIVLVDWNIKNNVCDDSEASLKDLEHYKVKQKLFTTEDGVDMYKGDNYYYTRKDTHGIVYIGNASFVPHSNLITFSTKEKAEEYIIMNKPCLSINDIISFTYNKGFIGVNYLENHLKSLVKQKSNL